MIDLERLAAVRRAGLSPGSHVDPLDGMCALEAVAWITRSPWNDAPTCVSPVISAMVRDWNDRLEKPERDRLLVPLIPVLAGSAKHVSIERRRAREAADWRIRTNVPIWLNLAGQPEQAASVAALPHASLGRWDKWIDVLRPIRRMASKRRSSATSAIKAAEKGADRDTAVLWAEVMLARSGAPSSGHATALAAARQSERIVSITHVISLARDIARDIATAVTLEETNRAAAECTSPDCLRLMKAAARHRALLGTVEAVQQSAARLIQAMVEITETRH